MEEARKSFHRELNDIQQELVRISAGVVESIPKCTTVLLEQDLSAAETMLRFYRRERAFFFNRRRAPKRLLFLPKTEKTLLH